MVGGRDSKDGSRFHWHPEAKRLRRTGSSPAPPYGPAGPWPRFTKPHVYLETTITSAPLLTKLQKAQNVSFLHSLIPTRVRRAEEFVRWWVHLCTTIGRSWFPAAGFVLLWGKRFINSADPTPALVPLLFHSGTTEPRRCHFTKYFWTLACAQAEHIPAGISSERIGRRKRAKGCRILNHTLRVSQPDVQSESSHSFTLRPIFPWCIRNARRKPLFKVYNESLLFKMKIELTHPSSLEYQAQTERNALQRSLRTVKTGHSSLLFHVRERGGAWASSERRR